MGAVLHFALAVLIYPGILVAVGAGWLLLWLRQTVSVRVAGGPVVSPLRTLDGLRLAMRDESVPVEGTVAGLVPLCAAISVIAPLVALIFLPVPGNPVVASLGIGSDLAAEGALLLGMPIARLLLDWALPSTTTRASADARARLIAGAVLPLVLAITAIAQEYTSLRFSGLRPAAHLSTIHIVARVFALAAYACSMVAFVPGAVSRPASDADGTVTPTDSTNQFVGGRDRVLLQLGEAVQFAAIAGFFIAAFVLPLTPVSGLAYALVWIVGTLVVSAALGAWEAWRPVQTEGVERPPLTWWLGIPTLLGLIALVAAAWAGRGV